MKLFKVVTRDEEEVVISCDCESQQKASLISAGWSTNRDGSPCKAVVSGEDRQEEIDALTEEIDSLAGELERSGETITELQQEVTDLTNELSALRSAGE